MKTYSYKDLAVAYVRGEGQKRDVYNGLSCD